MDLMEMDISLVANINRSVYLERKDQNTQANKSNEIIEDAMQGEI